MSVTTRFPRLVMTLAASVLVLVFVTIARSAPVDAGQSKDRKPFARAGSAARYGRDRVVDVRHVALDIRLDFAKKAVVGTMTAEVRAINGGLRTLPLDAAEMRIKGARLVHPEQAELTFRHDGHDLHLDLGKPRGPGELLTIAVDYEATPRRGLYFVGPDEAYPDKPLQAWTQGEDEDSQFWFPCWDYPNDKASFECRVSVPKPMKALSNGRLIASGDDPKDPERNLWHWRIGIPQVTYLATLAAGDFAVVTEEWKGIPVSYWVEPGREEDAKRSLGNTIHMLGFFSDWLDLKYPYEKYDQVCVSDFLFGGMENTTATTLTDTTLHDARAHLDFSSDGLVAHELAHQWFGDLLTCRDWSHAWLNEGFATYFETLWREDFEGRDAALYDLHGTAQWYLGEDRDSYRRPVVTKVYEQSIDLFDGHLYGKGALVLHALRGELGDDLFRKAMRHYVRSRAGTVVDTHDLIDAIREATGRDLEWFFDQWVFGKGYPELTVKYDWEEATGLARIDVAQTQSSDDGTPAVFRMSVNLVFLDADGRWTRYRVTLDERKSTLFLPVSTPPVMFRFDAGHDFFAKSLEVEKPDALWLKQLVADPDVLGRVEAAAKVGKLGTDAARAALQRSLMKDEHYGVQIAAAEALGAMATDAARDALLGAFESSEHPKTRLAVVTALGELEGDRQAAAALRYGLENGEPSYFVEAECARSVGKVGGKGAFEALVAALPRESWRDTVRAGVLEGLAALDDHRAIPILLEHSERGRSQGERRAAINALAELGKVLKDGDDDEVEGATAARTELEALLFDPEYRVQQSAIRALKALGDPAARDALWKLVRTALDGRTRRDAREAMDALYRPAAKNDQIDAMREQLDDAREDARALRERIEKLEKLVGERREGGRGDGKSRSPH